MCHGRRCGEWPLTYTWRLFVPEMGNSCPQLSFPHYEIKRRGMRSWGMELKTKTSHWTRASPPFLFITTGQMEQYLWSVSGRDSCECGHGQTQVPTCTFPGVRMGPQMGHTGPDGGIFCSMLPAAKTFVYQQMISLMQGKKSHWCCDPHISWDPEMLPLLPPPPPLLMVVN